MNDPSGRPEPPALAVDDLRVRLGSNEILRGVSYAVRPGRIAALLGRSGSGKTTLLRCVAGLETPTAGSIAIGATQVFDAGRGIDVPTERRNLGLVFQSYALWPHKTVFDNVAYGLRVRGAARADIEARVAEVLQGVGLGALIQVRVLHRELAAREHPEEVGDQVLGHRHRGIGVDEGHGGQGARYDGAWSSHEGRRSPSRLSSGPRSTSRHAKTLTRWMCCITVTPSSAPSLTCSLTLPTA